MSSIYKIDQQILDCVDFETGEVIDQERLDALEIERSIKIESIACWIKNLTSDINGIKAEEEQLAQRRKAKERKIDSLSEFLKYTLNCTPFESVKCKVSFRRSKSVNIIDETTIPSEYIQTEIVTKIDKKALGAALKGGELIDGAELKENFNIQIK